MRKTALALVLAVVIAPAAQANDTTAELSTGGLIFVPNEDVEMRSEDLFISAAEVRVRYQFVNKAKKDVTVLVAFPMPEIRIEDQGTNISIPTEDPVNILAFRTMVDGKPVDTKVEQRVIGSGLDRTQYLRALGIPLAPHLRTTTDALSKLPPEKWDELQKLGLAEVEEYDIGQGMKKYLGARWALHTTYYWEQTFPAGGTTTIEHRYQPSVGGTAGTSLGNPRTARDPSVVAYTSKFCLDRDFFNTMERARRAAKSDFGAPYSELRIDYILKTGANWSGPIKDFRLVVDKGDADSVVSFCGEGIRKISPTQFEMRKKDFVPAGNLSVLIMKKMPPP